ncbi:hypothetical protein H0G86_003147 [Trichoderma simmonsii]|uniref:Nucleoside phosphorylase domain-containing protein n=1 Tax=Trichoderma simmonsii TaxID=1491479 RepID=A0A8G0PE55_9HYPO|nr:hypothetical protein H0G86_003147 [Trichoderma simmonsii]
MEAIGGTPQRTLTFEDYTVGWICLHSENSIAARAFLDEEHERPNIPRNDDNAYTLGHIGSHNIVIAGLALGGFDDSGGGAAGVASDMLNTFPNIKIGLVAGIGNAAPSPKHGIKLGDVVVSAAGGVSQIELSEEMRKRIFQMTGFAVQPSTLLRTAVDGLKARYKTKRHQFEEDISRILKKYDGLAEHRRPEGAQAGDKISIHYGSIVSGGQVMKDTIPQDKPNGENDVLCTDTAVSGLMNGFPCLAIRGICDDSDPNKKWQGYAGMAAAAYAKDLLNTISQQEIKAEKTLVDEKRRGRRELFVESSDTCKYADIFRRC